MIGASISGGSARSVFRDPPFDVAFAPDATLGEFGERPGEVLGVGELVGALPADLEYVADLGGPDEFHAAQLSRQVLTLSSSYGILPLTPSRA